MGFGSEEKFLTGKSLLGFQQKLKPGVCSK